MNYKLLLQLNLNPPTWSMCLQWLINLNSIGTKQSSTSMNMLNTIKYCFGFLLYALHYTI